MRFIDITLRNLFRRPVRTVLTVLGITVGVGSLVALLGMSRGADRAFLMAAMDRETHVVAVRKGAVDLLSVSCDEKNGFEIAAVEGIKAVAGELYCALDVENERDGEILHMIVTGWPRGSFLWKSLELAAGSIPGEPLEERFAIVLGQNWAEALGKGPGDMIELLGYPVEVVGVATSKGVANRQMSFLALTDLQQMEREEGKVSGFNIQLVDSGTEQSRADLCASLGERFSELNFFPSEDLAAQSAALGFLRAFTGATSAIAVCVALIVTLNTLLMSVTERLGEFGIYSAMGWSPSRILALVVMEGTALSLVGGVIGVVVGWLTLNWIASRPYLIAIETRLDPALVATGGLAIVALGIGGSLYPAWRASRAQPIEAIKRQ